MLGVVLLYVGIVLIHNGVCRISQVEGKSMAVLNLFVGGITLILDILFILKGEYYAGGTGLLFTFTYLYVGFNSLFNLDTRPYGWYSLFVAINTIPAAMISYFNDKSIVFAIIWVAWGVLWLGGFIESVCKKELKFIPYLAVIEGILTAWIPGFLLLMGYTF